MNIILWIILIVLVPVVFWALLILSYMLYEGSHYYAKLYFAFLGRREWSILFFPFLLYPRYAYVQKHKSLRSNEPHVAIIVANNWFPENYFAYGIRIDLLVKYLRAQNKPYRVYDKLSAAQIREVIADKKVNAVLLFGHGTRHNVQTGKDEMLYYCECAGLDKKDVIGQFHCNHLHGKSLADYISKKDTKRFIHEGKQGDRTINKQILDIIRRRLI